MSMSPPREFESRSFPTVFRHMGRTGRSNTSPLTRGRTIERFGLSADTDNRQNRYADISVLTDNLPIGHYICRLDTISADWTLYLPIGLYICL